MKRVRVVTLSRALATVALTALVIAPTAVTVYCSVVFVPTCGAAGVAEAVTARSTPGAAPATSLAIQASKLPPP